MISHFFQQKNLIIINLTSLLSPSGESESAKNGALFSFLSGQDIGWFIETGMKLQKKQAKEYFFAVQRNVNRSKQF